MHTLDDSIGINNKFSRAENGADILRSLSHVSFDVHSETWCLRDRQPEVQANYARNTSQADKQAPHVVNVVKLGDWISEKGGFIGSNDDHCHQ